MTALKRDTMASWVIRCAAVIYFIKFIKSCFMDLLLGAWLYSKIYIDGKYNPDSLSLERGIICMKKN